MKSVWTVGRGAAVSVSLRAPGDKSISQRAAILSALSRGESRIEGFLTSEDGLHTLGACELMGARVRRSGETVEVNGCAGRLSPPRAPLDLGNSGTGMRLLTGVVAGQDFEAVLTGDESLSRRPMKRVADPLTQMGADIRLNDGHAPITVRGGALKGIRYSMPVASAQVKSCVLLAGLYASGDTEVIEPAPSRDHTERMLAALGVPISVNGSSIRLEGDPARARPFEGRVWKVPGDVSSAAYWMAAAAAIDGSMARLTGVGLNPRRTAFIDVLRRMGAEVTVERAREECGEPVGDVVVRGRGLRATVVEGSEIPNAIDEIPLIAALGATARGTTSIRNASELRVKESDRIATTAGLLEACGARVETWEDGLSVQGGAALHGAEVDSHGDHRIAMTAAVLGLVVATPMRISGVGCVATSYPGFFRDLRLFTGNAHE